ncbi:MAG: LytR C-terminal domain-containing protein [bacterium]|nr:LytR C-terminal domain-containing protein [bacterium]
MAKKRKVKKSLNKAKRKIINILVCIGIITVISGFAYGLWAMRNIAQPLSVSASSDIVSVENSNEHQITFFNLEINNSNQVTNASVTLIDNEENVVRELSLPQETMLHLPYGMKDFKLQGLYKMANLENSSKLFSTINQTLIDYFGVATQNIYITKNSSDPNSYQPYYSQLSSMLYMFNLTFNESWLDSHIVSPDSRWKLLTISKKINNIPSQNRSTANILDTDIGTKETDIDGATIIKTDFNKLDSYIKKIFQNTNMLDEKANISIENGTTTSGLGNKVSRLITNMGGVVVSVGNSEIIQDETIIKINDKKWIDSSTLNKITKTLPQSKLSSQLNEDNRTDILIILGKDYAKLLTGQ